MWESAVIRLLDIVIAACVLVLLAPVMVVIALAIRADSPGRAIFGQERLGLGKRRFKFYKFRTMYADAADRFPDLYTYEYAPEEILTFRFKIENDPRLTRVGRFLRRTSLDELPNFINVLMGDVTLVGPRPEIPEMLKYYLPWQSLKWQVKPGVTGYAQVQGRGLLTFQETVHCDVQCVLQRSLRTYVSVLLHTVTCVLKGIGAF